MFMVLDAPMAKSEIPSIVVQTGCTGNDLRSNGSLDMDGPHRQLSRQSRLAKQEEIEIEEDGNFASSPPTIHIEDDVGSCKEDEEGATASFYSESGLCGQDSLMSNPRSPGDAGTLSPDASRKAETLNSRSGQRVKLLVRSQAVHDDASPPPPEPETLIANTNTLTVTNVSSLSLQSHSQAKGSSRLLIAKQGSSQGTGSLEGSSPSLSRDSSTETYTHSTGIDLQQFIVDTLHKSQKDRLMLFKIEQDLMTFVKDNRCQTFKFSPMSSYNRMLVHRVAAFFGLEHNVDKIGTSVIANKTKNTRIPDVRFQEHVRDELVPDEPKKLILKRDSASFEEGKESPERQSSMDSKRSKSFEEREEEYEKARARIFNQDSLDILLEGYGESPYSRSQDETLSSRRSSQEDLRWVGEPRPWSSTDSDSSGRKAGSFDCEGGGSKHASANRDKQGQSKSDSEGAKESLMPNYGAKPTVTKASSFGGISLLVSTSSTKPTSRLTKSESLNATSNVTMVTNVPCTAASSIGPSGSSSLPSPTKTAVIKVETPSEATLQKIEGNKVPDSQNTSVNAPLSPKPIQANSPQISSQTGKWDSNMKEKETQKNVEQHWSGEQKHPGSNNPSNAPYYGSEKLGNNPSQNHHAISQSSSSSQQQQSHLHVPSNSGQPIHSPITNTPSPLVVQQMAPPPPQQSHSPAYPPAANPAPLVYIPYPPIMSQSSFNLAPPQPPHPMTPILSGPGGRELRHLCQDGNVAELTNQLATIGFGPGQPSAIPNHNGPLGSHSHQGNSVAIEYAKTSSASSATTQSYYVPSDKGQGFAGQQPSTQFYYIHQFPPPVNMRYVCPNQTGPSMKGGDGISDCGPPQSPSPHLSGQQILPGYSIVTFSQNSDNLGYSTSPYNYVYVNPGNAPPSNNVAPHPQGANSNPNSLPIYPYSNALHVYGSASGGNSLVGPQNSSQLAPPPQGGAQFGHHPSGPLPVCVLANGTNNSNIHGPPHHNLPQGGSHHFGGPFRPRTPPTQSANSMGVALGHGPPRAPMQTANNQTQLTTPFVSYAFFSPPMHHQNQHPLVSSAGALRANTVTQSHVGQPNPTSHQRVSSGSLQTATVHPPFMTAFQVLRPGIPMSNVRNSTPPPPPSSHPNATQQNIIPIQLPTPPPPQHQTQNHAKGSGHYPYTANKIGELSQQQHHHNHQQQQQQQHHHHHNHHHSDASNYKGGGNPKMGRISGPLQVAPTQFRMTGPVYRGRPLSLMQDVRLVGHPLQQQLNPTLFPPQHQPRGRFPPPQMNSPFGPPNLVGRGPKSRKQRTRWTAPVTGQIPTTGSNIKSHSHILHPDDIYTKGGQMILVEGIPDNMKRIDLERYLEPVTSLGAKVQLYNLDGNSGGVGINGNLPPDFAVNLSKFQVYAVFENEVVAQTALINIKTSKFQLRLPPTSSSTSSSAASISSSQHQQNYHRQQQHAMVQTHPRGGGPIHPLPSHHHHHHHNNRYQQHHKEGPQSGNKSIS